MMKIIGNSAKIEFLEQIGSYPSIVGFLLILRWNRDDENIRELPLSWCERLNLNPRGRSDFLCVRVG